MADNIHVTPDLLRTRSGEYNDQAEAINDVITRLDTLRDNLQEEWAGASSEAFIAQYEELKPSFQKMQEITVDVSNQLSKAAEIMERTDQEMASQMGVQ